MTPVGQGTDVGTVRRELGLDDSFDAFLTELAGLRPEPGAVPLPGPLEARRELARLRVSEQDGAEAVAALPDPDRDPQLWWLLTRCRHWLVSDLGGYRWPDGWPTLPAALGARGRYFYLAVLLATLPDLRRYHAQLGVPKDVCAATLSDVGEKVGLHRRIHGIGGMDRQDWFTQHFRGSLYALGRLQFHLARLEPAVTGIDPAGPPADSLVLACHIPETGPLEATACDRSFARAREFFARHFGARVDAVTCQSWLLDPQLAEYLPADSNIVRFQRRFHPLPASAPGDDTIIEFVFRRCAVDLADLPQRSTLERAVVEHLRAGRHWQVRCGWVPI